MVRPLHKIPDYLVTTADEFGRPYVCMENFDYFNLRYGKHITGKKGDRSDGATWAIDIRSLGWWVHDKVKVTEIWEDGTACSNWQASWVIYDILWAEKKRLRAVGWGIATFVWGEISKGILKGRL